MWKNGVGSHPSLKCYKHTHDVGLAKKKTSEFSKEKERGNLMLPLLNMKKSNQQSVLVKFYLLGKSANQLINWIVTIFIPIYLFLPFHDQLALSFLFCFEGIDV